MLNILLATLFLGSALSAYVEAAATGVKTAFAPSVAFKAGYRNMYLDTRTGAWITDQDRYAGALTGKRDILKYCRKVYPKLDVTNIVEDTHFHKISSWCKETDATLCKWTHTVRPFKCVVGQFESEALLVPSGCRFGHVDGRSECNDFAHWENTSHDKCKTSHDGMEVRSFALLAPCGLDMYSGVEFVCCPRDGEAPASTAQPLLNTEAKEIPLHFGDEKTDEDPDDPYYDDDDSDEYDEDDSEEDDYESEEDIVSVEGEQDPYFRTADPDNEHENFKAAERRLENKHRDQVAKKTAEWEELSRRYVTMKVEDPTRAESFKAENTMAFQKTIAALEAEFQDARRQIDEVHQERVQAALNERKRTAIKEYRDALADSLDKVDSHRVLRTLQAYIRSEEKDRHHALNRFKHLLRTGDSRVTMYEAELLRKLKDIDLRINGTIAMLHDEPKLEEKVKPVIVEFWITFRKENSADVGDDSLTAIGGTDIHLRLIQRYKHNYAAPIKATGEESTLRILDPVAEAQAVVKTRYDDIVSRPLEEDASDFAAHARLEDHFHQTSYSEEAVGGVSSGGSGRTGLVLGVAATVLVVALGIGVLLLRRSPRQYQGVPTVSHSEEAVGGVSSGGSGRTGLVLGVAATVLVVALGIRVLLLRRSPRQYQGVPTVSHSEEAVGGVSSGGSGRTGLVLGVAATVLVVALGIGVLLLRRSPRQYQGVPTGEAHSPEEKHVVGMQVAGYENPTYRYFDEVPKA